MSWFDSLTNIFTGKPVTEAANQNKDLFNQNYGRGMGQLAEGWAGAKDAYGNAIKAWEPLGGLADKYGQGRDMLFNSLGINGAEGNAAAVKAFQTGPGYEFAKNQALEASTRGSLARSGGIGGNQIAAAAKLGGDYANQEFGGWQNRLTGLSNNELVARNAVAGGTASGYGALGAGYQNNATNQVNLGNTTSSANANQNNMSAQAQMQGSGNLWNMGMNAAKLFTGGGGFGGGGNNNGGGFFNSLSNMFGGGGSSGGWGGSSAPAYTTGGPFMASPMGMPKGMPKGKPMGGGNNPYGPSTGGGDAFNYWKPNQMMGY